MPVSPLGNVIQVHQNMTAAATKQANFQSRLDLQESIASAAANEKNKEIQEVRPAEESYKIDPENEHEKQKHEQEQEAASHHAKAHDNEDIEDESEPRAQHLDIKI